MLIPTRTEITHGLTGAWLLLKHDPGGVVWLDNSVPGLRKSFYAAVLIAPAYMLLIWIMGYAAFPDANLTAIYAIESAAYVVAWLLWPVIAWQACQLLDPGLDVRRYVVALNWSEVWIMLVRLPVAGLYVAGLLDIAVVGLLDVLILLAVLVYRFVIAQLTLPAPSAMAAGLAFGDLVVGFTWRAATSFAAAPYLVATSGYGAT